MASLACGPAMRIIGIIAIIFLTTHSAFGQFLVNPPTIRKMLSPGRRDTLVTSLNNMLEETQAIDLRLIDLTQGADGTWQMIEPDDPNADRSTLKSCRSWLKLEKDTITLDPSQMSPIRLDVTVPRGTAGYYFAAIAAAPQPRVRTDLERMGTSVDMGMVIPIVIQVRARALRTKVVLADLGLTYQRLTEDTQPATLVHMMVNNEGTSYSRLQGVTRISRMVGGYWRRLAEVRVPPVGDQGIIPDAKLDLAYDVGRPLPRGQYKIEGFLVVDGRRADQLEKIVQFEGDLRAPQDAVEGAALDIDPLEVLLDARAGRAARKSILVANASEQEVAVDISAILPEHMYTAALPWTRDGQTIGGAHFDCSQWLSFQPSEFTMDGYGRQRVVVRCDVPESVMPLAEYFAMLKFHARFPDGQDAGTTQARLYLDNTQVEPTTRNFIRQMRIGLVDGPNYQVTADCVNLSDAHYLPRCRCVVRTPGVAGINVAEFEMVSDTYAAVGQAEYGPMLPMESRTFTGILNIASLDPGEYIVFVQFDDDIGGDPDSEQDAIEIVEENGVKSIVERDLADVGGIIELRLQ
jgi:hypothetical protein